MIKNYALGFLALLTLGLGASTYYYKSRPAKVVREAPLVLEKEVVVTKEVAKIVTQKEIKKPDGTVITETRTEDKVKESSKDATASTPVPAAKSKVRAGVKVHSGLDLKPSWEVTTGIRIGKSNAWAETGYNIQRKEVSVGLSYEF